MIIKKAKVLVYNNNTNNKKTRFVFFNIRVDDDCLFNQRGQLGGKFVRDVKSTFFFFLRFLRRK